MQLEFKKYKFIIELLNEVTEQEKLNDVFNKLEEEEIEIRQCSNCSKLMVEGYVIENGEEYYCCDKCLESNMSRSEFEKLYKEGDGESYFTQWD